MVYASVDVTAPEPVIEPHAGDLVAEWTFENHTANAGDNIGTTPTGFFQLNDWAATIRTGIPKRTMRLPSQTICRCTA